MSRKKLKGKNLRIEEISKKSDQLVTINKSDLIPLPYPYDNPDKDPAMRELSPEQKERYDALSMVWLESVFPNHRARLKKKCLFANSSPGLQNSLKKKITGPFSSPSITPLNIASSVRFATIPAPHTLRAARKEIYRPTFRPEVSKTHY